MSIATIYILVGILYIVFLLAFFSVGIYMVFLVIKALRKYINSKDVREEKKEVRQSLAEILKSNRIRCKMTQEFVSEAIGVSRQAVSKWEKPGSPKQRKEAYHPAASFFYREKATAAVSF